MAVLLWQRRRAFATYARKRLPSDVSDDAVEETLDRVGERALAVLDPSIKNGDEYVKRLLRDECARTVRTLAAGPVEPDPVIPGIGRLVGPLLDAVLHQLSPQQRSVIWKRAHDHLTYKQIAKDEGLTEGTARLVAFKARRKLREIMRNPEHAAPVFLLMLPRRLRMNLPRLVESIAPHSFASVALVPLLALFATTPTMVPAPVPVIAGASGPGLAMPSPTLLAPVVFAPTGAPINEHATVATFVPPSSTPSPAAGHTAATETPEDVTLTAVAAPASGRPVLVAIGRGNTCNCSVLMRSMDGGATWDTTGGPPADVNQLAVPPTYPNDPRIFGGVSPALGGAPYMAAAFRQPFKQLSNLPAGQLAVSAHFDDGDPRVFSAGQTAVWSIRVGDATQATPHDEVDSSAAAVTSGTVSVLATPAPAPGGPAVLAWVPALATVPGSAYAAVDSAVMQCPVASACTALSDLPVTPWHLVTRGASVVLAYSQSAAYLSHDGGGSFVAVALPHDVGAIASITTASSGDDSLWASVRSTNGGTDVIRVVSGGMWVDAAGNSTAARTLPGLLLAVGNDRLIEEFSSVGYRCTSAQTIAWTRRCPSA